MLQDDAPYYIVNLVQRQKISFEHARYSTFFIQWIPFCFLKAGAGLESITRSYSLAFGIYYLSLFLIAVYVLNNLKGALLLILFLCISAGRDFFLPVGEYQPAMITTTILFGVNLKAGSQKWINNFIVIIFLLVLITNFHLIGVMAATLIITWNFFRDDKSSRKYWLYLFFILLAIALVRSLLTPRDDYESDKLGAIYKLPFYLTHPRKLSSLLIVIKFFTNHFPQVLIAFGISILLLLWQKRIFGVLLLLGLECVLLPILGIVHGINIEFVLSGSYFLLMIIPMLIPIINFMFSGKRLIFLSTGIVVSITLCVFNLAREHKHFKKKTDYFSALIEKGRALPEHRYIIDNDSLPAFIGNHWPLPFQTLILSSLHGPESSVTYISGETTDSYDSFLNNPGNFLGPAWWPGMFNYPETKLPERFFNLPNKGYRKLSTIQSGF